VLDDRTRVGDDRSAAAFAGSEAEFGAFFVDAFPRVTRTVALILHDARRAEDVAQDAFVQLLRNWDKVSRYDRPDAWVRRVAIRLAMRALRRDRLWSLVKGDIRQPLPLQPRDLDVADAIRKLPGMQRAAVILFYFEDLPIADVAAALGCAEPTARVHLHRARRRLADLLHEEADDVA
jgi:RNA polymerase sigma-70 factor (ECF subfamily)